MFRAVAQELRLQGHEIVSPVELDTDSIHDEILQDGYEAVWRKCLLRDLEAILSSDFDGLALLPGWQKSRGAQLEAMAAYAVGIPLFDALTLRRLPCRPCWAFEPAPEKKQEVHHARKVSPQ